jgi:hypothetical protein
MYFKITISNQLCYLVVFDVVLFLKPFDLAEYFLVACLYNSTQDLAKGNPHIVTYKSTPL